MLSPEEYLVLYGNVHSKEVEKYVVRTKEIKYAIRNMVEVYKPDPALWKEEVTQVANYDDPAYRCAYLFKYAPLHTCLVQDMFFRALTESAAAVNPNFWSSNKCLNICNLGGGPGIDTIGVLSALHRKYGFLRCSAQIIETMPGWKDTFQTILEEFKSQRYGLSANLTSQYFEFSYIVADLLGRMDSVVNKAIGSANFVTMIKFLSAATCKNTGPMIKKIFNSMRHGSVILIIDNASGGYSELISRMAEKSGMMSVFGPLQYVQYTNPIFNVRKYGSRSCYSTQVTVHLLMKSHASPTIEWNSLKLITMDYYKIKSDNCSSSKVNSIASYGKSVNNYDNWKKWQKNFKSGMSLTSEIDSIQHRCCNGQMFSTVSNSNFSSTQHEQFVVAPCSEISFQANAPVKADSKLYLNGYENLENKFCYKASNFEKAVVQVSYTTNKSLFTVSEEENTHSRVDYPLYQLFPQTNIFNNERENKSCEKILKSYVEEFNVESNQKHAAAIFENDFEKQLPSEKTIITSLTECKYDSEDKFKDLVISRSSVNDFKDVKEIERECSYCSKLKRIKWLQKMCNVCKQWSKN